ncbi:SpoIIE family protein phosphatase [Streptomyces sp. NPDC006208]|uniref:SpoIIE family protein phosphatase n=1 Tax=Streptomyces sp. NPDC006208 TaxID=3156734 RepID=UPI0033A897C8
MDRPRDEPGGDELLDEELADTVRRTGASGGGVFLIAEHEPVGILVVVCGSLVEFAGPWRRVPLDLPLPGTDAVRENRLVWVGSQEDLARSYPRAAAALPYQLSLAAAPLTGSRHCWGALLLVWPPNRPPHLTPRERSIITAGARRLARVLDDAGHPPAIPDEPRIIPLHRAGPKPALLTAGDFAERLPGGLALDLEGRITFLTAGAAELLGRSTDQLLGTFPEQSLPWLDDPSYEDRYRTALVTRRPVACTVLRPPDQWLELRLYPDASGISVLISPAGSGQTSDQPQPTKLSSRGNPSGSNADVGRLYQLMHLAAALTETVGVQDVVDLVADQVLPAFGAHGLILSTADADRLKIIGHRGYTDEAIQLLDAQPVHTDLTPAGHVMTSGVPAFFDNPEQMAGAHPRATPLSGKQAWAFLPLITSGHAVGCCTLSYQHPHAFTAAERATVTSLAGLVAQALDRARLYDAKHELAHSLQRAFLPGSLPTVPGITVAARYLPAGHGMDIGGDFYDFIRLSDTTAAAIIGDVQGHNVTAAALMGQVRTAVHAHATAGAPPDQVLARTNRFLADLETELFVSCLYVHLDLARHRACLTSAGHLSPLLRHHSGPAEVIELPSGLLLGIDPAARYDSIDIPLPPGTLLALYTDGLIETPGIDLGQSTTDLATQLVRASEQTVDSLADTLIRHATESGARNDDIALLLIDTRGQERSGPTGTTTAPEGIQRTGE